MPQEHWVQAAGAERVLASAVPMDKDEHVEEEVAGEEEMVTLGISHYHAQKLMLYFCVQKISIIKITTRNSTNPVGYGYIKGVEPQ